MQANQALIILIRGYIAVEFSEKYLDSCKYKSAKELAHDPVWAYALMLRENERGRKTSTPSGYRCTELAQQ